MANSKKNNSHALNIDIENVLTPKKKVFRKRKVHIATDGVTPYIPCTLYHYNKSTRKKWQISYYQVNRATGEMIRRFCGACNSIADVNERMKQAKARMIAIDEALRKGMKFNPSLSDKQMVQTNITDAKGVKECFKIVLAHKKGSISVDTYDRYARVAEDFFYYLDNVRETPNVLIYNWTKVDCIVFLDWLKKTKDYNNKSYNARMGFFGTIWNTMEEMSMIEKSPMRKMSKLKTMSKKNRAFTDEQAKEVLEEIDKRNMPHLGLFVRFIYYTYARPHKEVRLLKVKDIEPNRIFINAHNDKNSRNGYVSIPPPLNKLIEKYGIRKFPKEYYVFGKNPEHECKPGEKPWGEDYFMNLHREVLRSLGYGDDYTCYGWKHTGNIANYRITKDVMEIMRQNRHTDITSTMKYLRELGVFDEGSMQSIPEI